MLGTVIAPTLLGFKASRKCYINIVRTTDWTRIVCEIMQNLKLPKNASKKSNSAIFLSLASYVSSTQQNDYFVTLNDMKRGEIMQSVPNISWKLSPVFHGQRHCCHGGTARTMRSILVVSTEGLTTKLHVFVHCEPPA